MEETKLCAKCGKCLSFCPVYQVTREEILAPRGRVSLLEADLLFHEALAACLLCGACEAQCPNRVPITKLILKARLKHPSSWLKGLPWVQNLWPKWGRSFKKEVALPKEGEWALFLGCGADFLYPETTQIAVSFLEKQGLKVSLPEGQHCCGLPALSLGGRELFVEQARQNLKALSQAQHILTLCTSCLYTIAELYPYFLEDTPLASLARHVASRIKDLGTFLFQEGLFPSSHTACLLQIPCHLRYLPREKWWSCMGIPVYEGCCGGGGFFGIRFRETSFKISRGLTKALGQAPFRAIITSCTSCWLFLKQRYPHLEVKMLPHLLEERF